MAPSTRHGEEVACRQLKQPAPQDQAIWQCGCVPTSAAVSPVGRASLSPPAARTVTSSLWRLLLGVAAMHGRGLAALSCNTLIVACCCWWCWKGNHKCLQDSQRSAAQGGAKKRCMASMGKPSVPFSLSLEDSVLSLSSDQNGHPSPRATSQKGSLISQPNLTLVIALGSFSLTSWLPL